MRAGGVDLSVQSQDVGDAAETVDGDYAGEDLVIAFNPSYLIDGVEAVSGDEVIVETADASRAATVRVPRLMTFATCSCRCESPERVSVAVSVRHLELADFRLFHVAQIDPEPEGTTVITGPNGTGKTSVLEALAYLGTRRSFRGAPAEALVRSGAPSAIIRADIDSADSPTLVEAEIRPAGRSRTRVNRKFVAGRKELGVAAPCTIFCPEDLAIISGGPSGRRDLLDDALSVLDPEGARAADETDRVLRQRAALLRQSGGRNNGDVASTLDVWDQRLADAGKVLVAAPRTAGGRPGAAGRLRLRPPGRSARPGPRPPAVHQELGGRPARRTARQPGG